MVCPICKSAHVKKNGEKRGRQTWRCRDCGRQFADSDSALIERLKSRYGEDELEAIANGRGTIHPPKVSKPVTFAGDIFKALVITDTHEGSQWVRDEWLDAAIDEAKREKVDEVWHAGDVTEGMSGRDGHIYELKAIGYQAQRDRAVERFKRFDRPLKAIAGNHDLWFMSKGDMGADIVKDICSRIDGAEYLGPQEGDIDVKGVKVKLFHGEDGSSYALSYRPQKIVESLSGGEKPAVLITGHDHKAGYFFIRNVHVIMGGCLQSQTPFMRRKKISAMPGFYILTMCIADKEIKWIDPRFYPFYK